MATISTVGISNGSIIYAAHPLDIIHALDGTDTTAIKIKGDFNQGNVTSNSTNNLNSFAHGNNADALGAYSHAEGQNSTANGAYSHAEGSSTTGAGGTGAHAEGFGTNANGQYSHAEGEGTTATGNYSHAQGYNSVTVGPHSLAAGNAASTGISAQYSIALGTSMTAYIANQVALGRYGATTNSTDFVFIGTGTGTSTRKNGFGINNTTAYISASSVYLPEITSLSQPNVLTFDSATGRIYYLDTASIAPANALTGTGAATYVTVWSSATNIVTGSRLYYDQTNKRLGINTGTSPTTTLHVSGNMIVGEGISSVAANSLAGGSATSTTGVSSIVFGSGSSVTDDYSAAFGKGVQAAGEGQVVVGQFNNTGNTSDLFVVGNGANAGNRDDAFKVGPGDIYAYNDIYLPDLNGTGYTGTGIPKVVLVDTASGQLFWTGSNAIFDSSSYIKTASVSTNVITFTKGDGSTFPITVDTGSGAAGTNYQIQYASASKLAGSNGFVYYYPSSSMHVGSTSYGFTGVQYSLSVGNNNQMSSTQSNAGNNLYVGQSNVLDGPVGNSILVGAANQFLGPMDSYSPVSNALMVGSSNIATSASQVVVMGYNNTITGPLQQAVVLGANNTMLNGGGGNATILGPSNYISASNTGTAIGQSNYVIGDGGVSSIGVAIGILNTSSGNYASFAAGYGNKATGVTSVALGNSSVASGNYSLAGGAFAKSSNFTSFAFGYSATASADYAVSIGQGTVANAPNQFVIGRYNATSTGGYPFVIGAGTSTISTYDAFKIKTGSSGGTNFSSMVLPIQTVGSWPPAAGEAGEIRLFSLAGTVKMGLYNGTAWVTASLG